MVASVGRITAGRGYDYLTKSVATNDHDYYTGSGEAAGVWAGRGSAVLGLAGEVDADDMAALYGRFVLPSTAGGKRLHGGRIMHEVILGRKVSDRTRSDGSKSEAIAALDVTFSPSTSVSVLWALTTNAAVRQAVVDAHDDAVAVALEYLDAHAGHTRTGAGGLRRMPGNGLVVAQFRHRTARSTDPARRVGDPQLHSHCAILNRLQGADGKWRTLDSKAIYHHAHAAGAVYAAELERLLTERLGVAWEAPAERVPMREIVGIPIDVLVRFSTRTRVVVDRLDEMVEDFLAKHGRTPTRAERERMHDQATVKTRHTKGGTHDDLHTRWRAECSRGELLAAAGRDGAVTVAARPAKKLGDDQAAAVKAITTGDRLVQTVVGPAGDGNGPGTSGRLTVPRPA